VQYIVHVRHRGLSQVFGDDTGVFAENGAIYTGNGVEIDGNIITATSPATAKAWAEAVVNAII